MEASILSLLVAPPSWKLADANLGIEGHAVDACLVQPAMSLGGMVRKTGSPSEDEVDMLDLAFSLSETSRLGCQIEMSDELNGLKVAIPEDI